MATTTPLLLGLDLGTTAVKGLLCDGAGLALAAADHPVTLLRPQPGWVEQDMRLLWQAVVSVTRRIVAQIPAGQEVTALSLSVASGNTVLTDAEGQPLGPAIHWMDSRAEPELQELLPEVDPAEHYGIAGWTLSGMSPLGHLAWLRQHDPMRLAAARRVCMTNDTILHRMCGQYATNPSDASTSGLYDQVGERWHQPYLRVLDVSEQMLSPIVPSGQAVGTLTPGVADEMGLTRRTLVVNGAHDQVCAALGAGVLRSGEVLLSCGTAWVILFPTGDRGAAVAVAEGVEPYLEPGRWAAMISLYGAGLTPQWYLDVLRNGVGAPEMPVDPLYALFNAGAATAMPGANGLVFSPLEGGRAPFGALVYLRPRHTHGDVVRAIMEGAALESRIHLDRIRQAGFPLETLKVVGGAMQSRIWTQIAADVFAAPVTVVDGQSAAARGAAMLAGLGAGLFSDLASSAATLATEGRRIEPDVDHVRLYDVLFERYMRTVELLRTLA